MQDAELFFLALYEFVTQPRTASCHLRRHNLKNRNKDAFSPS